jgi:hypothetical protein
VKGSGKTYRLTRGDYLKVLDGHDELFSALEETIRVPDGFLMTMYSEPSDAFLVVKANAVIESVLNQIIEEKIPGLRDFVWRLPMKGNGSRPALALHLSLISKAECAFVNGLADIRNRIAHSPRALAAFSLDDEIRDREESGKWLLNALAIKGKAIGDLHRSFVREHGGAFFCSAIHGRLWGLAAKTQWADVHAKWFARVRAEAEKAIEK